MPDAQSVQKICMCVQCVDTYRILLQQMLWLLRESEHGCVLTDFSVKVKHTAQHAWRRATEYADQSLHTR